MTARPDKLPREIWVLVGAAFLIAVGFGLVAPVLPIFVRGFDVGITAASLVISGFAFSRLVFAPVGGRLVTRFGEVPVFLVGLTIVAASTGACAFATEYWHLLLFRVLGGTGSTMFTVSAVSLLVRLAPLHMRGRASSMWATGFLLGNLVGPLIGGVLVVLGMRAPFLIYAGTLLLVVAVTWPLLGRRRTEPVSGAAASVEQGTSTFGSAVRTPAYRSALVASFANGWAVFGVRIALVPLMVVEALRLPESWGGIALAVFAAGNTATLLVSGRIADRRGRKPPLLAGLALSGVATAVLGFVTTPWLFLALCVVAGLGSGLVNPPLNAVVADVLGARTRGGTVLAGFQMAADLGAIVGPVLAGFVAEQGGYDVAFAMTGGLLIVAFLVWLRGPETLPVTRG